MKLIIQIPCLNEEHTLPTAVAALPKTLAGIDSIETLVIDDGSTDGTVATARRLGATHIVSFDYNRGLAEAFNTGIFEAAKLGADILVNFDADNQYCADDIGRLIAPLLAGRADLVIGERPIREIAHFSLAKRVLQRLGSWVVAKLSGTDIKDTPSGFRALNRRAMLSLHVFNPYTYTNESLLAAREQNLRVIGVPVRVTPGVARPSRLIKSMFDYVVKSAATILRFYMIYNPYPLFLTLSVVLALPAVAVFARFLYFFFSGEGAGYVQSLVLGAVLMLMAFGSFMTAVVCDMQRLNRRLQQKMFTELRELHLERQQRERDAAPADPAAALPPRRGGVG